MVHQNSLEAWLVIKEPVRLSANQVIILNVLQATQVPMTNKDILNYLNRNGGLWSINRITPRVKELLDCEEIKVFGNTVQDGRTARLVGLR
jgi:hypothetical protein